MNSSVGPIKPSCPVCTNPFDEQERLPLLMRECGHTFCKQCLVAFLGKKDQGGLQCFVCRRESSLSENDLELTKFPVNYAILGMLSPETETAASSETSECEVCPKHLLPATLTCLDAHQTADRSPLCVKCALQQHKKCNEGLIIETRRLSEKVVLVPLDFNVERLAVRLRQTIEENVEALKQRQLRFLNAALDVLKKEEEFVKSLADTEKLVKAVDILEIKWDKQRNMTVLSHPRHQSLHKFYDDLQAMHSKDGMWKQLELTEIDQTVFGMREYLRAKRVSSDSEVALLENIRQADPFIASHFILPPAEIVHLASLEAVFARLGETWSPRMFERPRLTVLMGEQHKSLEKVKKTVVEVLSKTELHSHPGRLNHDLFKALNFSLKNIFIKPLGFITCKMSTEFRNHEVRDPDRTIVLKVNEMVVKVRV